MSEIEFPGVTARAVANVYFDGGVVSHAITFTDGSRKTLGLIFAGSYEFATDGPERMEITAGSCRVRVAGQGAFATFDAGSSFDVPGKSRFEIAVDEGVAQYVCSFL